MMISNIFAFFSRSLKGGMQRALHTYGGEPSKLILQHMYCYVSSHSYGYEIYANCYHECFETQMTSNMLTVYKSRNYDNRQEAEANLDIQIINASKHFREVKFYRTRYLPEYGVNSEVFGEDLCCQNANWFASNGYPKNFCGNCGAAYYEKPEKLLCEKCGEPLSL